MARTGRPGLRDSPVDTARGVERNTVDGGPPMSRAPWLLPGGTPSARCVPGCRQVDNRLPHRKGQVAWLPSLRLAGCAGA